MFFVVFFTLFLFTGCSGRQCPCDCSRVPVARQVPTDGTWEENREEPPIVREAPDEGSWTEVNPDLPDIPSSRRPPIATENPY